MEKFNILEDQSYRVNHLVLNNYLAMDKNKLIFAIQKLVNKNNEKKAHVLSLIRSDFENNEKKMLEDILSRKLFQAFIIASNPWDINDTYNYLRCYDMCTETLQKSRHTFDINFVHEFVTCAPTYTWETKVESCFKNSFLENRKLIETFKDECERKIKLSYEMRKFMQALNPKIKLPRDQ